MRTDLQCTQLRLCTFMDPIGYLQLIFAFPNFSIRSQQFYQELEQRKIANLYRMTQAISTLSAVLLAILLWSAYADCPLSFYPRQTTIGYIRADIDSSSAKQILPQTYEYPLVEELKGPLPSRTVVGVNGLSLEKKGQQFGYKIQVQASRSPAATVVFRVTVFKGHNNDRWHHISFIFIVSEIPELILGTKSVLQFIPTSDPNTLKVAESISLPSSNFNYKLTSKIFLAGLQIKQKSSLSAETVTKIDETISQIKKLEQYSWNIKLLNRFIKILSNNKMPKFSLSEPQFNPSGLLTFEVKLCQVQIRAFSFSYLIYVQKTNSEILYQTIMGSFSLSEEDTYFYNQLENDAMKIIGITGFTYSTDTNGIISLEIQYGKQNDLNFFSGKIQGLYGQFTLNFFGISTLPGAACRTCPGSPLIFRQFCVSECPLGFVSSINSDGSFYCHECKVQNFLIAKEDRQACICASGHYFVSPAQSCDRCPYDCLTCNGNTCLSCDTPIPSTFRILNPKTGRCECQATNYMGTSLFDDARGQTRKCVQCNPRCRSCLGPQIHDCLSCSAYRTLHNGICRCEQNFIEDVNGQCVCLPPYAMSQNGRCVLHQNKCKQNQKLGISQSGEKVCNCITGYSRSLVSNICLKECQSYEELNYRTGECECRKGCTRDPKSRICIQCSSRLNQVYNQETKECECVDGYQMNKAGNCIQCPPKTYFNINNDACECIFNYYKKGNVCVKCQNQRDGPGCRKLTALQGMEL